MGVSVSQLEKGQESSFWSSFNGDVILSSKASILRGVSCKSLWDNFLMSTASSFALTLSDLSTLLRQSLIAKESSKNEDVLIRDYVELIRDLNDQTELHAVDFMGMYNRIASVQ